MDSLIKMYEEKKKAAKDRGESVEYYSQVLTNLKRKKITEAPKEPHIHRLAKMAAALSGQTVEENAADAEKLLELHRKHFKYTKTD